MRGAGRKCAEAAHGVGWWGNATGARARLGGLVGSARPVGKPPKTLAALRTEVGAAGRGRIHRGDPAGPARRRCPSRMGRTRGHAPVRAPGTARTVRSVRPSTSRARRGVGPRGTVRSRVISRLESINKEACRLARPLRSNPDAHGLETIQRRPAESCLLVCRLRPGRTARKATGSRWLSSRGRTFQGPRGLPPECRASCARRVRSVPFSDRQRPAAARTPRMRARKRA